MNKKYLFISVISLLLGAWIFSLLTSSGLFGSSSIHTIGGDLVVLGSTTYTGTSTFNGATTFGSTVAVPNGATTLSSLTVTGTSALQGATTLNSTLGVPSGLTTLSSLTVTGTTALQGTNTVTGLETLNGGLVDNGNLTVSSTAFFVDATNKRVSVGTSTNQSSDFTVAHSGGGSTSSTFQLGTSFGGSKPGEMCIWNGTNITVLYFAPNSASPITATSTVCP